ncbi:MAG: Asp-tRNA(Asn)/Glu-tRNA(Gln) amidotransferase subunit GatC [Gammaproteobacteria bacterium]
MSTLTNDDVKKIAHLARIEISEEECEHFHQDLVKILNVVEEMNKVDTDDVEPLSSPIDARQRCRIDEVTETDQREHFQKIAPQVESGLYIVPKVIENVTETVE